jgi:hypothetical protein
MVELLSERGRGVLHHRRITTGYDGFTGWLSPLWL